MTQFDYEYLPISEEKFYVSNAANSNVNNSNVNNSNDCHCSEIKAKKGISKIRLAISIIIAVLTAFASYKAYCYKDTKRFKVYLKRV